MNTSTRVEGPTLTPQGFRVMWQTALMPAPAFWYFAARWKATEACAGLLGIKPQEYRQRQKAAD